MIDCFALVLLTRSSLGWLVLLFFVCVATYITVSTDKGWDSRPVQEVS
jgi:hypothetical protein